jgi:ferredoxin
MEIDKAKCVGCGNCHAICPMGAIYLGEDGRSTVSQDDCVECLTCYRVLRSEGYPPWFVRGVRKVLALLGLLYAAEIDLCPTGALSPPDLEWPRSVRRVFSDPTAIHAGTGVSGRGTEEIKSNDVTGRLRAGDVGIVLDIGRPGTGARFREIEKVAQAVAALGVTFEPQNPVTQLMADTETGTIKEDVLDEKVLSAIIELKTRQDRIPEVLSVLETVQERVDVVFAVGIASRCLPDGSVPHEAWVRRAGYGLSPNGKTNLGLGRPAFQEG